MKISLLGLIVSLFVASTLPSRADVTVSVGLYSLSVNPVNIKSGDVVYWVDGDEEFAPYIISGFGDPFFTPDGIQFLGVGTYNYTAQSVYGGGTWGGTINVGANSLPSVTITSPTNNAVLPAPATFAFTATASDADPDDVWDVEFWIGNVMVDDVYDPPYTTTVSNLASGTYTLKAIVWDYSYAKATNTISITVGNSGSITLTGSALVNGSLVLQANGLVVGKTNRLQYATNLVSPIVWLPVSTNVATSTTASFTNAVTGGQRFFRIVQSP